MLRKVVAISCVLVCTLSVIGCNSESKKIGGVNNFDKAITYHYEVIYKKDLSKWLKIVPVEFLEEHEDIKEKLKDIEDRISDVNPEEILPSGLNSLSYETEDLTEIFEENPGYNDVQALKSIFSKYGVDDIENVWHVESNFEDFENETLIIKADGKYFSTYAFGYILGEYGEDCEGLFY